MLLDERLILLPFGAFSGTGRNRRRAGTNLVSGTSSIGTAGTYRRGNIIDMEPVRDIGAGAIPLYWVWEVTVAGAGGTSIAPALVTSDTLNSGSTDLTSPDTVIAMGVISNAHLALGARYAIALPQTGGAGSTRRAWHRYLAMQITSVGTYTALSMVAWINFGPPKHATYADASN